MTTEIFLSAEETATRLDVNIKTFRKYFAASSIDAASNATAHPVTTVMQGRKTLYSWPTVQLCQRRMKFRQFGRSKIPQFGRAVISRLRDLNSCLWAGGRGAWAKAAGVRAV